MRPFTPTKERASMKALSSLKYMIPVAVLALGLTPISVSASTVLIYITNSAGDSIHVIDPVTKTVVKEIKNYVGAHGIDFSPDGTKVYVTNEDTETLDVLDRATGKLIKKVTLSGHPNIVAVTKTGKIVVAIARGKGGLDVIDGDTLTLKKTISTNGGRPPLGQVLPGGELGGGG